MGRAVLAETDRIVGQHEDHPLAHQRREADRRPAVVGEDQERAAVGDHAAVQGHAVHGRGHGVLAHPEMDVAAARRSAGHRLPSRPVLVLTEPVRSAEPPTSSGTAGGERLEHLLAGLAGRPGRLLLGQALLERAQDAVEPGRQRRPPAPARTRPGAPPAAPRDAPARPRAPARRGRRSRARPRGSRAGSRTADRASRAARRPRRPRRRRAASRGSRRCPPCRRAVADRGAAGDQASAGRRPAPPARAASIAAGSWPSTALARQP